MNLRDWRVFVPFIMAGYIVTRFVGVALHEIVGHGLISTLLGGSCYAVFVSPSAGYSYIFMPDGTSAWADAAVNIAGIAVEVAVGTLLLLMYRRINDSLAQLIALLFLQVLLFQAFLYMAFGSFPETGGDTSMIVLEFNSNALQAVFTVAGITLAVLVAYLVTRELLRLLAPSVNLRKWLIVLTVFWLFPVLVDILLEGLGNVPPWPFFVVAIGIAAVAGYLIGMRYRRFTAGVPPAPSRPLGVAKRDVMALGITLVVISATWLSAFGPNTSNAHGVLLSEPPVEAELQWFVSLAIDMHAYITRTGDPLDPLNMSLEFRFRGIPELESPLDRKVWDTFDSRAYFPFYEMSAIYLAEKGFNTSGWTIDSEGIDGSAWSQGQTYENARVITLSLNATGRQQLLPVSGGALTLLIRDPFKYNQTAAEGYVDEVIVGWGAGLMLVSHSQQGGSTTPDTFTGELRWQNPTFDSAPALYSVVIRLL